MAGKVSETNYRTYIHSHHAGALLEAHHAGYLLERAKEFEVEKAMTEPGWKVALRQRLFRDVSEQVPVELSKAIAELAKAETEWDRVIADWNTVIAEQAKAKAEWDMAKAELDGACEQYGLNRLHDLLCRTKSPACNWTEENPNIFGE